MGDIHESELSQVIETVSEYSRRDFLSAADIALNQICRVCSIKYVRVYLAFLITILQLFYTHIPEIANTY